MTPSFTFCKNHHFRVIAIPPLSYIKILLMCRFLSGPLILAIGWIVYRYILIFLSSDFYSDINSF